MLLSNKGNWIESDWKSNIQITIHLNLKLNFLDKFYAKTFVFPLLLSTPPCCFTSHLALSDSFIVINQPSKRISYQLYMEASY